MEKQEPKAKEPRSMMLSSSFVALLLLLHEMDEESVYATNIAYEPLKNTTSQRLDENEIEPHEGY